MKIVVIGTGYVGLTTGVVLAYLGNNVTCLDIDQDKIAKLKQGHVPFYEPGLQELLELARPNLHFTVSYDEAGIDSSEVVYIAVGTPSLPDGSADFGYVKSAAEAIGLRLGHRFTVVVNKSTVPVGSGNWVDTLLREAFVQAKGPNMTGNYAVVSNPEFLRQGSSLFDSLYPDRVVIGSEDSRAIETMTNLYQPILKQDFPAPSFLPRPEKLGAVPTVICNLASAEMIKYAANAFLALKISYINEIATLAHKVGADISQIAMGIGLDKRVGQSFLQAGIGWGGSCFGKDTAALVSIAKDYDVAMPIVQAAREINRRQRKWVVETLLRELKILKGRTIAILGLAFKPNTDDMRDGPAIDIAQSLLKHGARVNLTDPVAIGNARRLLTEPGVTFHDAPMDSLRNADAIALITEWPEYRDLDWRSIKEFIRTPLVVDGRNFLDREKLEGLGYSYICVGR